MSKRANLVNPRSVLHPNHPARGGSPSVIPCCLCRYDALWAPLVASWIHCDRELTWLAPGTRPPLTPSKVAAWQRTGGRPFLFWTDSVDQPVGYAELNKIQRRPNQLWIGHFLLCPAMRGRGYGGRFIRALLGRAFEALAADEVLLVVFPDNQAAIQCYEKNGMMITAQERKYFDKTRRHHLFLRMEITRHRFKQLMTSGRLPRESILYFENDAMMRQGILSRRRAINESA